MTDHPANRSIELFLKDGYEGVFDCGCRIQTTREEDGVMLSLLYCPACRPDSGVEVQEIEGQEGQPVEVEQ